MSQVSLEVPDDLLLALREQPSEFAEEVRLVSAVHYLRQRRLSLGQAARLAGMNRLDFLDALAVRDMAVFDLSADDAAAEVEAGRRHNISK
jgi:predicted HTH domain antitoxin